MRAGEARIQRTIYLGTDAGSVHALTVRYPADSLQRASAAAWQLPAASHEGSCHVDVYHAVHTQSPAALFW